MPQLKKIPVTRSNILPRLEFPGENIYSTYEIGHQDLTTYVPIFSDTKLSNSLSSEAESDGASSIPNKPRKRQRLDHLSQEEKIMRRKMKNRVAAQTARDRKKARMAELEEQVLELETERKMLMLSNMNLQAQNEVLQKENEELKRRLSGVDVNAVQVKKENTVEHSDEVAEVKSRLSDSSRSIEHASFINVPLQKGQDLQLLTLWMMHFAYLPMIARLMLFLIYCNSILMICSNLKTSVLLSQNFQMLEPLKKANHPPLKWWGPQQKAWNPTKN